MHLGLLETDAQGTRKLKEAYVSTFYLIFAFFISLNQPRIYYLFIHSSIYQIFVDHHCCSPLGARWGVSNFISNFLGIRKNKNIK